MEDSSRINIIELIKQFGVANREDFLFAFRTFIKNVTDANDKSINLTIRSLVETEFKRFGGNQELIIDKITEFSRSIIKSSKNKSFSNLLISLISNYLNALKFDPDKHIVLSYPNNEFWDNFNADEIEDLASIDIICKIYKDEDVDALSNTTITVGKSTVAVENLKIKTRNNFEKSIKSQKLIDYRNMLVKSCDEKGLKGKARNEFINEKLTKYKSELE